MPRLLAALVAVPVLALGSQALAHAHLTASDPVARSTVPAPRQISLHFTEALNPKFSGAALSMPQMADMATPAKVSFSADKLSMILTPAAALPAGAYKVSWHAVTEDTHRTQGDFVFSVK